MSPTSSKALAALVCVVLFSCSLVAQQPVPPPEASQFDFWVGEWSVTKPDGKAAGDSRILSINNGRALLENWTSAGGKFSGKSLNSYDAVAGKWKQFWVDSSGSVLELSGGMVEGSMVLSGTHQSRKGGEVQDRITWTPNADGSVRQLWEQSTDGAATWKTVFDGHYVKKAAQSQ